MKQKYDFNRTSVNHWSLGYDLTLIMEHFAFLVERLNWFLTEGLKMFYDEKWPLLRYEGWSKLLETVKLLLRDLPATRSVHELYVRVIERGIDVLIQLANARNPELHREIRSFFETILLQFDSGPLGLDAHFYSQEKREKLIDRMVAVAQALEDEWDLQHITEKRFPREEDEEVRKMYIRHHKNW